MKQRNGITSDRQSVGRTRRRSHAGSPMRVRGDMDRLLAMEEWMQEDLDRGSMVSDHDLRHRIRLLGEQVRKLIEMNTLALEEVERPDCRKP